MANEGFILGVVRHRGTRATGSQFIAHLALTRQERVEAAETWKLFTRPSSSLTLTSSVPCTD